MIIMILYKVMSNYELKKMDINVSNNEKNLLWGVDTSAYQPKTEYLHFFICRTYISIVYKFGKPIKNVLA